MVLDTGVSSDQELTRLLAPDTPENFESWRAGFVQALELRGKGTEKKLTKKSLEKKLARIGLPRNTFEALQTETAALRKAGWNQPPGSRWLTYGRPYRALTPKPARIKRPVRPSVQVVRLALSGPVLPSILDAVRVSDSLHQALSRFSDEQPVFTGKENGEKREGHQHAYIVPEPNRATGLIDRKRPLNPMVSLD